ncbi:MAG: 4-(cytidine 5'-diphospho)-2-C-methyl-D-erythritol kinase [Lachnospiraceae bacterium]|nr:4-(cytidine 5'-diphospho)-2-C-methyl-D-erythritol kinase [Lachnospiraceae bacterium]
MNLNAYAKLNLLLNVHGKNFNGYHSIETVMMPLELHDSLSIEVINDSQDIIIHTNSIQIPTDNNNILYKCAVLFQKHFGISKGFKIFLEKRIPICSGLGGESADAAALIHFINNYFSLKLKYKDIFYFGRLLGWDVPICYFQKPIYINDLNSTCEFIDCRTQYYFLLIKPEFGISTTHAFINLDKKNITNKDALPLIEALLQTNSNIGNLLYNVFISCENRLLKEYNKLLQISMDLGFDGVSMTGTGSCFYLISKNFFIVQDGYNFLKDTYPFVLVTSNFEGGHYHD